MNVNLDNNIIHKFCINKHLLSYGMKSDIRKVFKSFGVRPIKCKISFDMYLIETAFGYDYRRALRFSKAITKVIATDNNRVSFTDRVEVDTKPTYEEWMMSLFERTITCPL